MTMQSQAKAPTQWGFVEPKMQMSSSAKLPSHSTGETGINYSLDEDFQLAKLLVEEEEEHLKKAKKLKEEEES